MKVNINGKFSTSSFKSVYTVGRGMAEKSAPLLSEDHRKSEGERYQVLSKGDDFTGFNHKARLTEPGGVIGLL